MKTYEEMARNALKRIEKQEKEQKKRRKIAAGIAVPAVSLCLAAIVGFGAWKTGIFPKMPAVIGNAEAAADTVIPGLPDTIDVSEQDRKETTVGTTTVQTTQTDVSQSTTTAAATTTTTVQQITTAKPDTVPDDTPSTTAVTTTAGVPQTTTAQPNTESDDPPAPQIITGNAGQKGDATTSGTCLFWWKNKLEMTGTLKYAIENNPGCVYAVLATYRPTTADITDFTYEGKTLSELAIEADNERILPDKMSQLLKQGDDLKYGTALYETGNPDGIIWDKQLYEQVTAYIGEELLNKYIVDGVFLREKLEKDIAALPSMNVTSPSGSTAEIYNSDDTARKKYAEAYNAYLETVLPSEMSRLSENGIQCERYAYGNNGLKLLVTEEQLENLPLDDLEYWSFDLWSDNRKGTTYETDDTVYPAAVN